MSRLGEDLIGSSRWRPSEARLMMSSGEVNTRSSRESKRQKNHHPRESPTTDRQWSERRGHSRSPVEAPTELPTPTKHHLATTEKDQAATFKPTRAQAKSQPIRADSSRLRAALTSHPAGKRPLTLLRLRLDRLTTERSLKRRGLATLHSGQTRRKEFRLPSD